MGAGVFDKLQLFSCPALQSKLTLEILTAKYNIEICYVFKFISVHDIQLFKLLVLRNQ